MEVLTRLKRYRHALILAASPVFILCLNPLVELRVTSRAAMNQWASQAELAGRWRGYAGQAARGELQAHEWYIVIPGSRIVDRDPALADELVLTTGSEFEISAIPRGEDPRAPHGHLIRAATARLCRLRADWHDRKHDQWAAIALRPWLEPTFIPLEPAVGLEEDQPRAFY